MVLGLLSAALGGAGAAADAIGRGQSARKAARQQGQYTQNAVGAVGVARNDYVEGQGRASAYYDEALGDPRATRSRVLQYADDGFRAEVDRVIGARDQARARSTQDFIGRGLFSSTAATSAQRGIESDSSRILGEVGAAFSGRKAGLDLQASGNIQQLLTQFAQFTRAQTDDLARTKLAEANIWAGAPVIATPSPLSTAGQVLGAGAGAAQGFQNARYDRDMLSAIQGLGGG